MKARRKSAAWVAAVLLTVGPRGLHAETTRPLIGPTAPFEERVLRLPGDSRRAVTIEVTLFKPDDPGPFPLAVMNHGSPDPGQTPADMPRYRSSFEAFYFLSRGYAVALPMLRGFAGSGGRLEADGCDLVRMGLNNARDIAAVIDALGHEADIDGTRVVIAGISLGGWNTLALGTIADPAVKGLLNFSGGARVSTCDDQDRALVSAAETFGRRTRIPSLWFYGDNDLLFPASLWQRMYDRYAAAGGPAQLVDYGVYRANAHKFTASGASLAAWTPKVDAFLAAVGLPNRLLYPQYLPSTPPPPSHFAAIDDAVAVPFLNEPGRALYRKFLASPMPRAFVLSSGAAYSESEGFDPVAYGLTLCRAQHADCGVYAYDNDVVWTGPASAQAAGPRVYRATVAANATAALNFAYSVNPDCSSRGVPKLWVTQSPTHGATAVARRDDFPRFPPASPYAICNKGRVPGASLTYTPAPGFTGPDTLTFEEITLDNQDKVFNIAITVK